MVELLGTRTRRRLALFIGKNRRAEETLLLLVAVLVGLGAGGGAIIFRWLIDLVEYMAFEWLPSATAGLGPGYIVLAPTLGGLIVGPLIVTAYPDEALDVALGLMGPHDLSRLPVVSRADPHRLLGVIRRNDLVRAYNLALTRKSRSATGLPMHLRRAPDTEFVEMRITATTAAKGRSVAELSRRFPSESLLISIRRAGGEIVFPRGDTRFLAGDRITAYVRSGHVAKLHEAFERPFA